MTCDKPARTNFEGSYLFVFLPRKETEPFVIRPLCISNNPVIDLNKVVFPAPLAPKRATISPSETFNEIPRRTSITSL